MNYRTYIRFTILSALLIVQLMLPESPYAQNGGSIQEIVVVTNMEQAPDIGSTKKLIINMCGLQVGSTLSR